MPGRLACPADGAAAVGRRFAQAVAQQEAAALADALATLHRSVRLTPAFAAGWNKRATVCFLLEEHDRSLKDCDAVLLRNAV